jgi:hypothetical protein
MADQSNKNNKNKEIFRPSKTPEYGPDGKRRDPGDIGKISLKPAPHPSMYKDSSAAISSVKKLATKILEALP